MCNCQKIKRIPRRLLECISGDEAVDALQRITDYEADYDILLSALEDEGICSVNGQGVLFVATEYVHLLPTRED